MGKVWTKQPPKFTGMDENNWFAENRAFFIHMKDLTGGVINANYKQRPTGNLITPVTQGQLSINGTTYSNEGGFVRLNSSVAQDTQLESPAGMDSLAGPEGMRYTTWIIKARVRDYVAQGSSYNGIVGTGNIKFMFDVSETLVMTVGVVTQTYPSLSFADQEFHTIAVVIGDTISEVYWDGVLQATTITHGVFANNSSFFLACGGDGSANRHGDCDIEYAGIFYKNFSAAQLRQFLANPYQVFQPKPQFAFSTGPTHEVMPPVKRPWTKQPPAGTKIDLSHPLMKNVASAYVFEGLKAHNLVTGNLIDPDVGHDLVMSTNAGERAFSYNAPNGVADPNNNFPVGDTFGSDGSLFIRCAPHHDIYANNPTGTDTIVVALGEGAGDSTGGLFYWNDREHFNFLYNRSPQVAIGTNIQPLSAYEMVNVLASIKPNVQHVTLNGHIQETGTSATTWATGTMDIGGRFAASNLESDISLVIKWDRALSEEESASMTANPWQIFEPEVLSVQKEILVPDEELPPIERKLKVIDRSYIEYPTVPRLNKNNLQANNLIAFWPLVNSSAKDLGNIATGKRENLLTNSGGSGNLTTVTYSPEAKALVRDFTGPSRWLNINDSFGLGTITGGINSDSYTITMRIKGEDSGSDLQYPIGDFSSGGTGASLYVSASKTLGWNAVIVTNGVNRISAFQNYTYEPNREYFLTIVVDFERDVFAFYLDGVLRVVEASMAGFAQDAGSSAAIGNPGLADIQNFEGQIWDVRAYRGALTLNQIKDIRDNRYEIFEPQKQYAFRDDEFEPLEVKAKPWMKQPPAGTKIDWNNPITKGLVFAAPDAAGREILSGDEPVIVRSGNSIQNDFISKWGPARCVVGDGVASGRFYPGTYVHSKIGNGADAMTMLSFQRVDGNTDNYMIACGIDTATANPFHLGVVQTSTSATTRFGVRFDDGTGYEGSTPDYWPLTFPTVFSAGYSYDTNASSARLVMYKDGKVVETEDGVAGKKLGWTLSASNNTVGVGDWRQGSPEDNFEGPIFLYLIWDRALSPQEVASLEENPWQIFELESLQVQKEILVPDEELEPIQRKLKVIEKPWTKQPPAGTGIDNSHPLAEHLVFALNGADMPSPVELVKNRKCKLSTTPPLVTTNRYGKAIDIIDVGDYIDVDGTFGDYGIQAPDEITVLCIYNSTNPLFGQSESFIGHRTTSGNDGWSVGLGDATGIQPNVTMAMRLSIYGVASYDASPIRVNDGPMVVAYSIESNSSVEFYRDGEQISTIAIGNISPGTDRPIFFGAVNQDGTDSANINGEVPLVVIFNKKLTAENIKSLSNNPWQIFEPQKQYAFRDTDEHEFMQVKRPWTNSRYGVEVDFQKDRQLFVAQNAVIYEYGDFMTVGGNNLSSLDGHLRIAVDSSDNYPRLMLNANRYGPFGSQQYAEADCFFNHVETSNVWMGPSVFIGGDSADTTVDATHQYSILAVTAGGGANTSWRLYRYGVGGWVNLLQTNGMPSASEKPLRVRIEAVDLGSSVLLRWWIGGIRQADVTDSTSLRLTHETSLGITSTAPGISFGHQGAQDLNKWVTRFKGGSLPESKPEIIQVPKDTKQPELATFERDWT